MLWDERYAVIRTARPRRLSTPLVLTIAGAVFILLALSASLTRVHHSCLRGFSLNNRVRTEQRKLAVREAMQFVWHNYHTRAFGADAMTPIDGLPADGWGHLGCMILDSMDTLWIMDLQEQFEQARKWVHEALSFDHMGQISVFETMIRSVGGLLSTYDLSGDRVFLSKAVQLADRLLPAINTTTGRAFYYLNTSSDVASQAGGLAESGSYQLEFEYLTRATGDPKYAAIARELYPYLLSHHEIQSNGLFVNEIATVDSDEKPSVLTLKMGGGGDSFYEYLLKVWILMGQPIDGITKTMYVAAVDGMERLLLHTSASGHAYLGEFNLVSGELLDRMEHLACFVPGMLALGAHRLRLEDAQRSGRHLQLAKRLMETCYKDLYLKQPTQLSPEFVEGPNLLAPEFSGYSRGYKLRPEVVESLYVMHQLTGDPIYQAWGWEIFSTIERNCRTQFGYAQYIDVTQQIQWATDPLERRRQEARVLENRMETFFTAETLKYLYLLFDEDNPHVNLDSHVFNTEAHPLSIFPK